jgi:PBP1b-binding outer membrane lipoprotein LpoB
MKPIYLFFLLSAFVLNGCSKVRESAGVTRKSIDEFQVVESPSLIIPPDFNLLSSDQQTKKNNENVDQDLAQEILFGLDEKQSKEEIQLSTMNELLSAAGALGVDSSIREQIDAEFSQEVKTDGIFQIDWENEIEVLDAVKESECIRNKTFNNESITDCNVSTKTHVIKNKKKKRFIFF